MSLDIAVYRYNRKYQKVDLHMFIKLLITIVAGPRMVSAKQQEECGLKKKLNISIRWGVFALFLGLSLNLWAAEPEEVVDLHEPIYRVTKQDSLTREAALTPTEKPHPLDGALKMARTALAKSRANLDDYTAIFVKRE